MNNERPVPLLRRLSGIRARLILIVLLAMLPLAALIIFDADSNLEDARERTRSDLRAIAANASRDMRTQVTGASLLLQALAGVPAVRHATAPACTELLADIVKQSQRLNSAFVVSGDGHLLCGSVASAEALDFADREWLRRALALRAPTIGKPVMGRVSRTAVLPYAWPILGADGRVERVLVVGIALGGFRELFHREDSLPGMTMLIWDEEGRILYRDPDRAQLTGSLQADAPLIAAARGAKDGDYQEALGLDGVPWIFAISRPASLAGSGLTLAFGIAKAQVDTAADHALRRDLVALVLLAGAVFALVWRVSEKSVRLPVMRLAEASARLRAGDLTARVAEPVPSGEIGILMTEFNATGAVLQAQATERKQAEATLKEKVEDLRRMATVVSDSNDAVILHDFEGKILAWNRGAKEIYGYSEAEALGMNVRDIVAEADRDTSAALIQRVRHGEIVKSFELRRVTKDGRILDIWLTKTLLTDGQGKPVAIATTERDITERKRAEATLKEKVEDLRRMATVVSDSNDAVILHDFEGKILAWNRGAKETYGYSEAEALAMNVRDIVAEPDREAALALIEKIKQGEIVKSFELRRVTKDGRILDVWLTTTLLTDENGKPVAIATTERDVTERKRAEEELRQLNEGLEQRVAQRTAQLEESGRAKSDFLANMSHELRTPLNAIIGFSEMLKDGVLGELDAKQRGFIGDIFGAGTHLLSLINDILDLSKVEAGMMQIEPAPVDLAALLMASTLVVREKALAHRIRLHTELDPALGTSLTDERKLKQIVFNLLSNAVKFTPEGGAVTLRARRCARAEVALDESMPARVLALPPGEGGEFLEISVADTGVGIAEEQLTKLFEPFVQLDSSVSRRQSGTGLGLSLVRRFAELHGGTVGAASRPGEGSRFSVWLPWIAAARTAPAGDTKPPPAAARSAPLALVVEDEDSAAEAISEQLRAEGYQVMRAATAEEGLARAAKSRPDLITLDIFLPEMDGWEFLRRLKQMPALTATAVVIVSVSPDAKYGLALGARGVLQKPFTREALAEALAGLIEARPNGEPARVLVVDDDPNAVELVASVLKAEGCRVMRAYGGAKAIEVVRRARPDLVILDLMMPEVSGFDVARVLRESEDTARIPILVLTAKDLTAEDRARLSGDVTAILEKGRFSRSDLLAELRRATAARRTV